MSKKFILFYFSGTGNTMWAALHLCDALQRRGIESRAVSIEQTGREEAANLVEDSDILGLAWPIYGSDMPVNMKRFIHVLPKADGKPLLTLCTQLLFSGDGAYVLHRALKAKGYQYLWCRQIRMPNNIYFPGILYPHDDYQKYERRFLKSAAKKINRFAAVVASGKKSTPGTSAANRALGFWTQRYWFQKSAHSSMQQWTGVDQSLCTSCSLCERVCPGGVIRLKDGFPEFDREKCVICMRCYNFCPAKAITMAGKHYNGKHPGAYKGPTKEIFKSIINMKSHQVSDSDE